MYYIYVWYVKTTGEVFYVGRGHGNRYKTLSKRTKYFHEYYDVNECESCIILGNLTEEEAKQEEEKAISYFRKLGMAKANIHNGGNFGGDIVSHMPEKERQEFIEKMTRINKARCSTDAFRQRIGNCTRKRYEDPEERKRLSESLKEVWTEEKRLQHGRMLSQYAAEHPEMIHERAQKLCKPCILEFMGKTISFPSLKALKSYLWKEYRFKVGERHKEQDMLKNKTPYTTTWKSRKQFEGLKMYYTV